MRSSERDRDVIRRCDIGGYDAVRSFPTAWRGVIEMLKEGFDNVFQSI